MKYRKPPDTRVPMIPPVPWNDFWKDLALETTRARAVTKVNTTVEWPREKKKPTARGRLPFCSRYRVVSSTAEMWSASKACRSPKV